MSKFRNIIVLTICAFPLLVSATTTASSTASTTLAQEPVVPLSFCRQIDSLVVNVRTTAVMKAAEHRAELQRVALEREEEKKKLGESRAEIRQKEDLARDMLIDIFLSKADAPEMKEAIQRFSMVSAKLLKDLRIASDQAREDYAKVTRTLSLSDRAKRNKALDTYIATLDKANDFAEEQCAKGANDEKVLASYAVWLKQAREELAENLKLKKSSLEQRAREVHERELSRLEDEYQRKMQAELKLLTDASPTLFEQAQETTQPVVPEEITDSLEVVPLTPIE